MVDHTGHRTRLISFFRTSLLRITPTILMVDGGSFLVMVSVRVDPRLEDDASAQIFNRHIKR